MLFKTGAKHIDFRSQGGQSASLADVMDMAGGFLSMLLGWFGRGLEKSRAPKPAQLHPFRNICLEIGQARISAETQPRSKHLNQHHTRTLYLC